MSDERVRYEILNLAVSAVDGVAVLLRKVGGGVEIDEDEAHAIAATLRAILMDANEELCGWGIDLDKKEKEAGT